MSDLFCWNHGKMHNHTIMKIQLITTENTMFYELASSPAFQWKIDTKHNAKWQVREKEIFVASIFCEEYLTKQKKLADVCAKKNL